MTPNPEAPNSTMGNKQRLRAALQERTRIASQRTVETGRYSSFLFLLDF
jgi:hypothetical protein